MKTDMFDLTLAHASAHGGFAGIASCMIILLRAEGHPRADFYQSMFDDVQAKYDAEKAAHEANVNADLAAAGAL